MPLKKVDKYSSKMTYAVDWSSLYMDFSPKLEQYPNSREYWKLRYVAIGVRKAKDVLELTYGYLIGVDIDGSVNDSYLYSSDFYKKYFIENYDTRYGISWVAKLSGEDDIILANSNSFGDYDYYYSTLDRYRELLIENGYLTNFGGWYQNA